MSRFRQSLIIGSILLLLSSSQVSSQQSTQRRKSGIFISEVKRFTEYQGRLIQHQRDLLRLAKSSRNSDEFEIASDCNLAAQQTSDRIDAASALLFVYQNISNKSDRAEVKRFIEEKFSQYVEDLDMSIEQLNLGLSYTKNADLKLSGGRLRAEIIEIKTFLESIKLSKGVVTGF